MRNQIAALFITTASMMGCQSQQENGGSTPELPSYRVNEFVIGTVKSIDVPDLYQATGVILPSRSIDLIASEKGVITDLRVDEGDKIKAGDLLAVIDASSVELSIQSAQSSIQQSQIRLEDMTKRREMTEALRGTEGSFSQERYRKSVVEEDLARNALDQAAIQLEQAKVKQPYHMLFAPQDGYVTELSIEQGETVLSGKKLMRLEMGGTKEFETVLPAKWLNRIEVNDQYSVTLHGEDKVVNAVISHRIPSVNRRTQMGKVKLRIDNASAQIFSGQSGQVDFVIGGKNQLSIPAHSLVERAGLQGVYRIDENNRVWFTPVKTERLWKERWVVLSGLKEGERIVIDPPSNLRDGTALLD